MTEGLGALGRGALLTLQALLVSSVVLLLLFAGFSVLFNLRKLRRSGRGSRVVRSLDEALGEPQTYLPPDAPRGPTDQLRTPELLESKSRKDGLIPLLLLVGLAWLVVQAFGAPALIA